MKHPFAFLLQRKDVKLCCRDLVNNLRVEELPQRALKATCKVCGRRHFLMTAEPFELGLTTRDLKIAKHPHAKGDGGPPVGRKIILP